MAGNAPHGLSEEMLRRSIVAYHIPPMEKRTHGWVEIGLGFGTLAKSGASF